MTQRGFPMYEPETAAMLKQHYKDVIDNWREMEGCEDTVYSEPEDADDV